jgi:hypothetical protein
VKQRNEKLVEGDHGCKDIQTQVYISFSNKDTHGPTNYITYSDPLNNNVIIQILCPKCETRFDKIQKI